MSRLPADLFLSVRVAPSSGAAAPGQRCFRSESRLPAGVTSCPHPPTRLHPGRFDPGSFSPTIGADPALRRDAGIRVGPAVLPRAGLRRVERGGGVGDPGGDLELPRAHDRGGLTVGWARPACGSRVPGLHSLGKEGPRRLVRTLDSPEQARKPGTGSPPRDPRRPRARWYNGMLGCVRCSDSGYFGYPRAMKKIRVISAPPGEAPQYIRDAWVGVALPLPPPPYDRPRKYLTTGVLSGPKNLMARVVAVIFGRCVLSEGYAIDTRSAIEALAETNPQAARWWEDNTPHLTKPGRRLVFPTDVCKVEE